MHGFPDEIVVLLDQAREIELATVGRRSGQQRRATVWVVVADGVPYVRSEYGDAGQWYRNALSTPAITVRARGRSVAALTERVTDPAIWRAVSDAFRAKYGRSDALGVMVQAAIEPMTMALVPAA